jgi:hypothetical protein
MNNNKQQTTVEWLVDQLTPAITLQQKHIDEIKKQAKEMEREQIIDGIDYFKKRPYTDIEPEQYYNETYGGNK